MVDKVHLFEPLAIRGLVLANRIAVAPMCQYSAVDGLVQDWHLQHYGSLAASGPGLIVIEATAVEPQGRITAGCLGLYSDACEARYARLIRTIRGFGQVRVAAQLGHAGRKGSAQRPWEGGGPLGADAGGWPTLSASAIPFGPGWPAPHEIGPYDIDRIRHAFAEAAERAARAGVDAIEVHSAHGYLLHQFLSPLSNRRTDVYGGSLDNRLRFPLEVIRSVRRALPTDKAMGMRISATDWVEGGFTPDEAVVYVAACKAEGVDYVCVSSGGLVPDAAIPATPGYQVHLAERIRRETGMPTRAVGLISDPKQAEEVVAGGQADMVALGRAFLDDPRWVWRAAEVLGADIAYPPQYRLARPQVWPPAKPHVRSAAAE